MDCRLARHVVVELALGTLFGVSSGICQHPIGPRDDARGHLPTTSIPGIATRRELVCPLRGAECPWLRYRSVRVGCHMQLRLHGARQGLVRRFRGNALGTRPIRGPANVTSRMGTTCAIVMLTELRVGKLHRRIGMLNAVDERREVYK